MHKPISEVVILGGTGFVGSQILIDLARRRVGALVLSRNVADVQSPRVLPGVRFLSTDPYDVAALARHLEGRAAVINLVGILNEKGDDGSGFQRAHVTLVEGLLEACRRAGVHRLLHMSALRAGEGESHYLRTKKEAEQKIAAESEWLDWTIFRPSVIFGENDGFLNRFADLMKLAPFGMPLACPGARFSPVYNGDVSAAFDTVLRHPNDWIGQAFELCGPRSYRLLELVRYVAKLRDYKAPIFGLPGFGSRMLAELMEHIPGKPLSRDNLRSLAVDSTCREDGLGKLGIAATALETIAPTYLQPSGRKARLQRLRAKD